MKTLILAAILLCAPSYAGAQVLTTVPVMEQGNHEPHDYSFGPVTVPLGARLYRVVFDTRDRLQGDQTMTVVVKRSMNGGLTEEPAGGAVFTSAIQPADFAVALPQVASDSRVLSGRVTLLGGRWRGRVYVEIE